MPRASPIKNGPVSAKKFGEWVIAARWPIILATLILVAAAGGGVAFLKPSTDYRIYFSPDNPELLAFESLENTYEKSDNVLSATI